MSTSNCTSDVPDAAFTESASPTTVAVKRLPGYSGTVKVPVPPGLMTGAYSCGTRTYTRSLSTLETEKSCAPAPLPALINAPTSVSRAVITPSNGATIFAKALVATSLSRLA